MREIKFRAWWLDSFAILENGAYKAKWKLSVVHSIHIVKCSISVTGGSCNSTRSVCIGEECIIEQFTGLQDKNGKEIYEGDIVKYESSEEKAIAIVSSYYGNNLYFCWQNVPDVPTNTDIFGCKEELEVIGNIHENPELLKGE